MKKKLEYRTKIDENQADWSQRLLIFTPVTGLLRVEWVGARYGQIIPTNWSYVEYSPWLNSYMPLKYQLADAQNLMARLVVRDNYEWVLFLEHDNVIPPDAFVRINEYMIEKKVPVVSGLYFTKGKPSEPVLYRGRGNSYYRNWKMGDKVWVDGIPFGLTLTHASLIKAAWLESPEYRIGQEVTRRVFGHPSKAGFDPVHGGHVLTSGTTDLAWCSRIMDDKLFEKAGWPEYQKKKNPFLVDTNLFVRHIDMNGVMYPPEIPKEFLR